MRGFVLELPGQQWKGTKCASSPFLLPRWQAHCQTREQTQEVAAIAAFRVCSSLHGFFSQGVPCPSVGTVRPRTLALGKDTTELAA